MNFTVSFLTESCREADGVGGAGKLSMPSSGHCSRLSGSLVLVEGGSWTYPEVSWAVPGRKKVAVACLR